MKKSNLFCLLLLLTTQFISATTHIVDDDIGIDNGFSPFFTIQAAHDAAHPGDIISVTGGADNIHTEVGIIVSINLTFQGQGQTTTIIQGNSTFGAAVDNIFYIGTTGLTVVFKDCTLRHGNATSSGIITTNIGGGAVGILSDSFTDVSFDKVTLSHNRSDEDGGAVYILGTGMGTGGTVSFTDCVISNNEANATHADAGGGGIVNFGASLFKLVRCTVTDNQAGFSGGGINVGVPASLNQFINCTIANNTAGGGVGAAGTAVGGGLTLYDDATSELINCTVVNNSLITGNTRVGGGLIYYTDMSSATIGNLNIVNTIIADNSLNTPVIGFGNDVYTNSPTNITQTTTLVEDCVGGVDIGLGVGSCPSFSYSVDPGIPASPATCGVQMYYTTTATNNGTAPSGDIPTNDICGNLRTAPNDIGAYDINAIVLPVDLLYFRGEKTEAGSLLNWETAAEINNSHFELEWSSEGHSFKNIGEIEGKGNSNDHSSYDFLHSNPANGTNYYRLKQVDYDGHFDYSEVISLNFESTNELSIYPNPTSGKFEIQGLESNAPGIKILDGMGKLLKEQVITQSEIDITELPAGVYTILVDTDGSVEAKRIVKNGQ